MKKNFFKFILLLFIILFFYTVINFYFSNENYEILKENRTRDNEVFEKYLSNLPLIKNDTDNVIEYNSGYEENNNENSKRRFWELFKSK
tara:strand:- start:38 stop:304 length:267 start_codon:yes stop_codon:yes gene_type:complete